MSASRWIGYALVMLLAFFYALAAVWSITNNTVLMGILIGPGPATVWAATSFVLACLATGFVPGGIMARMTIAALGVFTILTAMCMYVGYLRGYHEERFSWIIPAVLLTLTVAAILDHARGSQRIAGYTK